MLFRSYLAMGLVVSLLFSGVAVSGRRMFPTAAPWGVPMPGMHGSSGSFYGGGHHTGGGYHSTWHGGK
jgi:hypothetical protein